MAKIVIAGHADCPYFARAELLGDSLAVNLPDFKLHKIVKTTDEWQKWLPDICKERGWNHSRSPLVWRELIDRGGKGVLIGDANHFQEYAKGYYGIESKLISNDMRKVAGENLKSKTEVDKEEADYKAQSEPVHVCITSAAANVCYSMINSLSGGEVLGGNVEIVLHLLDSTDKAESLKGLKMEAEDLACNLLRGVHVEHDARVAFKNCNLIVLLDEIEQGDNSKDQWIKENADLFVNYAKVIDEVALKSVKVLVAGNGPVNFNTYMLLKNASTIPRQNIAAMSRMVENHAKAVIAERLKVNSAGVVDLIVWGNPAGEHFLDLEHARVHGYDGAIIGPNSFSVSAPEMVFDKKWMDNEFVELVKNRKSLTEEAMKHRATMSLAAAINTTLKHWYNGSPAGEMFSLGICSEGWYGIPKDLVFSYPVIFNSKGYWSVVQDINLVEETKAKIHATVQDLESEIEVIFPKPKPPASETSADDENKNQSNAQDEKKEDGEHDQRLETIVEEKKENSEEETDNTGSATDTTGTTEEPAGTQEKAESDGTQQQGESDGTQQAESDGSQPQAEEEVKPDDKAEEQTPTE